MKKVVELIQGMFGIKQNKAQGSVMFVSLSVSSSFNDKNLLTKQFTDRFADVFNNRSYNITNQQV